MQITLPRPIGNANAQGFDSDHRAYRAYPGLTYNIRCGVIGGVWPFTFSLSNEPAGMTIDADTGEINWVNPTVSATNVQVTVVDSADEPDSKSVTWSITVTSANTYFIDAINGHPSVGNGGGGTAGTGTLANPWQTLDDLYDGGAAHGIAYFKDGIYNLVNIPSHGSGTHFISAYFNEGSRPVIWLPYPGHSPILDMGTDTRCIEMSGQCVYVDGFDVNDADDKGFLIEQLSPPGNEATAYGFVFRRCDFLNFGPGVDTFNSGAITVKDNDPNCNYGSIVQDCTFTNMTGSNCAVKMYSLRNTLFEDCYFDTSDIAVGEGTIAMKADVPATHVRFCTFVNLNCMGVGGNQNVYNAGLDECTGEMSYCLLIGGVTVDSLTDIALALNNFNVTREFYVHHNTIIGNIWIEAEPGPTNGPYVFYNNVIINNRGGQLPWNYVYVGGGLTDPSILTMGLDPDVERGNLVGNEASGIVNLTTGALQEPYRSLYLGIHGHETT